MRNAFETLTTAVCLPSEQTEFETKYLRKVNRLAALFFALHVPAFVAVAYVNDTGPGTALLLTLAVLVGPLLATALFENPRHVSLVHGFTAMLMGGLLVHFGQGPVQIEMHFYFFALLAMLAIFANPAVILVAAGTVTVHHVALWYYLPSSVFNYEAPFWVVLVHAAFVVLESVATVYIARSFFDNVIGLERIVQARTVALDARNRRMRLVMDNVEEGLLTVGRDGVIADERSAAVEQWLGDCGGGVEFGACLSRVDPRCAVAFEAAFEQLLDGFLPVEVALEQFPSKTVIDGRHCGLSYTPIWSGDEISQLLIVVTDRTAVVARQHLEQEQREMMSLIERSSTDRVGLGEFLREGEVLVRTLSDGACTDFDLLKRTAHTLKGNAMLFEVGSVASLCERLEDGMAERGRAPETGLVAELAERWQRLLDSVVVVLDGGTRDSILVRPEQYRALLEKALAGPAESQLTPLLLELRLEQTRDRLDRVADHATRIARRLEKGTPEIEIDSAQLQLDPARWAPFWQHFIHVVRNAIDHGIEPEDERLGRGKSAAGKLWLSTRLEHDQFVVQVRDDGRGINWSRVRLKAEERGLPVETRADLEAALFFEGFTTNEQVTAYSGRGVGLSAVRAATEARGGRISVSSELGQGTTLEFRFPASQMAPSPQELLAA